MNVGWSDLGSWAALRTRGRPGGRLNGGSVGLGNRVDAGSTDSSWCGDRLVVTIGLNV